MRHFPPVLVGAVLLLSACGDGSSGGGPDAAGPTLLDPPPPANGLQLTTPEYTLQPGEEKYLCFSFRAPAEAANAIIHLQPIDGALVHHKILVQTAAPSPAPAYECNTLFDLNWTPVWAAGAGANPLELPAGAGFVLPPSADLVIQYHLQNAQDQAITERSAINLTFADDPTMIEPAGVFVVGPASFTIPSGSVDFTLGHECTVPLDMNVFAILPHMHKLGTKLEFEHGATVGTATQLYQIDPWAFGDQPLAPVSATFATGDFMRSTCHWTNRTGGDVTFGESSDNEMCFSVLFYYPAPANAPSGCVN